ncbi:hypothetical protein ACTFIV_006814 [Dictyostelium citrinum]
MKKLILIIIILFQLINVGLSFDIIYVNENSINSTTNENCGSSIEYPCRNLQSTIRNLENGTIILMYEGNYYYNYLNFENIDNHYSFSKIIIKPIDDYNRVIIQGLKLKKPFISSTSKKINIQFNSIIFTNFNSYPIIINSFKRNENNQEISFDNCIFKNIILNNSLILVENINLNFNNTTFMKINIISPFFDSIIYLKNGKISIKSSNVIDCFSKSSLFSINFGIVEVDDSNFKSTNCYKDGVFSMLDTKFTIKHSYFGNELTSSSINYKSSYNYNNLIDNCIFENNNNKIGGLNGIINLFSNFGLKLNDNSIIINSTKFNNNIGNSIYSNNFNSLKIFNSDFLQFLYNKHLNGIQSSHLYLLNNSKISIENTSFQDSFSSPSYSLVSINSKLISINENSKFITASPISCLESNVEINRNSVINVDQIECSLNSYILGNKICNIYYTNDKELICPTNIINFYDKNKVIILLSSILLFYIIYKII